MTSENDNDEAHPSQATHRTARRRSRLLLVKLAITAALLTLLWRSFDGSAALGELADADPAWITAGLLALSLQTVLSALRWRLTASRLGIRIGLRRALTEYYLSQIVNQALPGGVLGDAGRAVRTRTEAGLLASGQAVVFERLAGQLGLLVVLACGLLASTFISGGFDAPPWMVRSIALSLVAIALFLGVVRMAGARWFGPRITQFGTAFVHAIAAPSVRMRQAMTSLGTALCNIAAFACCAMAVGVALEPTAALVLVPLILLTMVIPATVSGWGLREGAAATLLPLAGFTATEGLAASLAFGFTFLASSLPGMAFLLMPASLEEAEA